MTLYTRTLLQEILAQKIAEHYPPNALIDLGLVHDQEVEHEIDEVQTIRAPANQDAINSCQRLISDLHLAIEERCKAKLEEMILEHLQSKLELLYRNNRYTTIAVGVMVSQSSEDSQIKGQYTATSSHSVSSGTSLDAAINEVNRRNNYANYQAERTLTALPAPVGAAADIQVLEQTAQDDSIPF